MGISENPFARHPSSGLQGQAPVRELFQRAKEVRYRLYSRARGILYRFGETAKWKHWVYLETPEIYSEDGNTQLWLSQVDPNKVDSGDSLEELPLDKIYLINTKDIHEDVVLATVSPLEFTTEQYKKRKLTHVKKIFGWLEFQFPIQYPDLMGVNQEYEFPMKEKELGFLRSLNME